MLIVRIYVNQTCIGEYGARRIQGNTNPSTMNIYEMKGTGDTIKHRYGDGANKLAMKMLRYVERRKYAHMGDKKRNNAHPGR